MPPPPKKYDGPFSDATYAASCEDPDDVFQADEDMLEACLDVDMAKLKSALNDGADVSLPNYPWQNTPLHLVCGPFFWDADTLKLERKIRLEFAEYLVRQGADTDVENIFGCKPIDMAVFHGYDEIVDFLERQGCALGWFGAAYMGNLERIKELLSDGMDIDRKGRYGRTAFAEAHLRGNWEVECFLAQQGCSKELSHPENMKFNPGGAAIPRGNIVPPREILYHRADDPEWYDNDGAEVPWLLSADRARRKQEAERLSNSIGHTIARAPPRRVMAACCRGECPLFVDSL